MAKLAFAAAAAAVRMLLCWAALVSRGARAQTCKSGYPDYYQPGAPSASAMERDSGPSPDRVVCWLPAADGATCDEQKCLSGDASGLGAHNSEGAHDCWAACHDDPW